MKDASVCLPEGILYAVVILTSGGVVLISRCLSGDDNYLESSVHFVDG